MARVLVVLALVCAVILCLLGFGVFDATDPKLFGWLGIALAFYFAADLVP